MLLLLSLILFHYFRFSLFFLSFLVLLWLLSFSLFFLYLLFIVFLFLFSSPFSLCTSMAFYIAYHDRICHFYPSTAFSLLWVSFQDYPLICRLLSHHHYTVLAVSRLIPDKSGFVLSFTPFDTPIRIRLDLFLTNLYSMHLVIPTHVYIF